HRLRVAISSCYWPMVWPSPEAVTLTIDPEESHLELPVLPSFGGLKPVKFAAPDYATAGSVTVKEPARETRRIEHDIETEVARFHIVSVNGCYIIDHIATEIAATVVQTFTIGRQALSTVMTGIS